MTQKIDLNGLWHNQYGSEMKLEVDNTGHVLGKFKTAVGRPETKKDWQETWFDVVGFVNGELISFVINFGLTGAICTVSGRIVPSKNRIETLSYTSYNAPEQDQWRSIIAASVIFERKS